MNHDQVKENPEEAASARIACDAMRALDHLEKTLFGAIITPEAIEAKRERLKEGVKP